MKKLLLFISVAGLVTVAFAQNTLNLVDNIFKANCTLGCHNSVDMAGLMDLSGTPGQVSANLVNVAPTNPFSNNLGDKRVDPGYPHRSFLFKKLNQGLDPHLMLDPQEGLSMPQGAASLPPEQIELMRQWILKGAPQTGSVVDTAIINKFYNEGGVIAAPANHPLPIDPGSFQVHVGRIFLPPTTEYEYFLKHDLRLPDTVEVNRIEMFMSTFSHHFIIYKLSGSAATLFPNGLRLLNPVNGSGSSTSMSTLVGGWQFSADMELPAGTAFRFEYGSVLDLNYHLRNYNIDSVMATDIYFNVYTQPKGTATDIMHSELLVNLNIPIPPNNQNTVFTKHDYVPNFPNWWNVWLLASHTHKLGIDYDIYLRNSDGTFGQQVYEGFYDPSYSFNQGYYEWQHPPVRKFDPLLPVNPQHGLIQQATFRNPGPNWVSFGLTTEDEMMLYFIQYTIGGPLVSVQSEIARQIKASVAPNPYKGSTNISYELNVNTDVKIEVFDILGNRVKTLAEGKQAAGAYNYRFSAAEEGKAAGIYMLKFSVGGESFVLKMVEIE
ncbi:MAG: T9SS type A sorting domain-containing protein [Bacteroidia bacterium]